MCSKTCTEKHVESLLNTSNLNEHLNDLTVFHKTKMSSLMIIHPAVLELFLIYGQMDGLSELNRCPTGLQNMPKNCLNCFRLNLSTSILLIWWMVDLQLFWVLFGPLSYTSRYVYILKYFIMCMGLLLLIVCSHT